MKADHAPDIGSAKRLLRQLAETPAVCTPRLVDKPLALYGAGNLGRMARQYFETIGIPCCRVVDANPELHGRDPFWAGVEVVSPEVVPNKECLLAVCVATAPFSPIRDGLLKLGWTDVVPFYDIAEAYRDRHPLGNGWFSGNLAAFEQAEIEAVLSAWQDDLSRAHHLQFIAWHSLREDWLFKDAPVVPENRYFIPEVLDVLGTEETFCDLGAHHGEVVGRFLQTVGNRCKAVWAVEPDRENFPRLVEASRRLEAGTQLKINVLSCVLGERQGRGRFFHGLGYASQLSGMGPESVEISTVDALNLAPSFLKLHLEGGELDALKGGLETLLRYRPVIAATAYHNRQGLWELPKWLMDRLPDYRFHFRLHGWCGTGAVVYGMPCERMQRG